MSRFDRRIKHVLEDSMIITLVHSISPGHVHSPYNVMTRNFISNESFFLTFYVPYFSPASSHSMFWKIRDRVNYWIAFSVYSLVFFFFFFVFLIKLKGTKRKKISSFPKNTSPWITTMFYKIRSYCLNVIIYYYYYYFFSLCIYFFFTLQYHLGGEKCDQMSGFLY